MQDVQDRQLLTFALAVMPSNLYFLGLRRDTGTEGEASDGLLESQVFLMNGV